MEPYVDTTLPKDPEGNPIITLDDPEESDGKMPPYDDTKPNLVEDFMSTDEGEQELKEIADDVDTNFWRNWEGQAKYRKRRAKNLKLYCGDLPKKEFPWSGAANPHMPIMLENMQRVHSRIRSELMPDDAAVFSVPPVGTDDENTSEILTQHGNWQIREQIPDFDRFIDRLLLYYLLGDATSISEYDNLNDRNSHRALGPEDFVTPYAFVSTMPDYGDLPHYTEIVRYYRHQLEAMKDKWFDVEGLLEDEPPGQDEDPETPIRDAISKLQGEEKPENEITSEISQGAPYVILRHEGWMRLPLQEKDRWCQVYMDLKSKKVLSLCIYEEADWQDRIRFENQTAEMSQYVQAMGAHQAALGQIQQHAQETQMMAAQGQVSPDQGAAMVDHLSEAIPPPPPPPQWLQDPNDLAAIPDKPKMRPIRMYGHGVCSEPLVGSLGIGIGDVLADYNRAANTALSQYVDSCTLSNASGLIVSDTVDFERPFSWGPGKINKVKGVSGMELKNAIMPFKTEPANQQLLDVVRLMQSNGQAAAQAPDVLSGDPGKSGETYRGIATRIEQATKQLTVVGRRFAQLVKVVLRNNARLNAVFLREEEIFEVTKSALKTMTSTAPDGSLVPLVATRAMYQRDYKVEIRSDMRFSGDAERVAAADQILQMTTAFPPLMQNMQFFYNAVKLALEARHRRDLVPYLGPNPGLPQMPLGAAPMPMPPGAGAPPQNGGGTGGPPQGGPPDHGPPPQQNHPTGPGGSAPGQPPPEPQQHAQAAA